MPLISEFFCFRQRVETAHSPNKSIGDSIPNLKVPIQLVLDRLAIGDEKEVGLYDEL